jgi:hypothetical protein
MLAKYQVDEYESSIEDFDEKYSVIISENEEKNSNFQQQYSAQQGAAAGNYQQQQQPQINPLLKQTSTASIGFLFALLIWRSFASYELADQFESGAFKLVSVLPTVLILCANLMGFVVNVMKPFNFKNYLKFILALNIIRECFELLYNTVNLVVQTSTSIIPREVYLGRFFMNVWWLTLCVTFSKSRWVAQLMPPIGTNLGANNYQQQPSTQTYQTPQNSNRNNY